jgi:hypothetical protein
VKFCLDILHKNYKFSKIILSYGIKDSIMNDQKVGEVIGGKSGQIYEVYYQNTSGAYRLTQKGKAPNAVSSRVVTSAPDAMRTAREEARTR